MDSYVGKRLDGRYEIREIIGVGGMAVVYKAYDNIDDRIVAIKILKEEFLANEEFRRRFKNESKAIAVLSHPNIVKVYDVSFGDRLQYIVMEYIEGITLKEYIEQQKVINWKEAVHFTTQILRALQHAHDKGIVHRDVKPQNIMLLQNGNIKVTDFGIARFSRGETRTMTESAIGSVHYISPEQARGEITDDKADIYSVGVVLYEMITGKLPFESDSAVSVAIMQLQNEAVHPRDINPQIPVGLEQITLRAMQKSTKDRYQSAAEMLLDLDEFKRNPSVKFDYSYFVDKDPTRFVSQKEAAQISAVSTNINPRPIPIMDEDDDDDYEDDEPNRTLPILVGVMSALLAVVVLIIIFLAIFTDIFSNDKVEVPDLLNKTYEDVVDSKEYDDWEFEVTYVTSVDSTYLPGQICKQSPTGGSKAKKGSTIKLEVVGSSALVEVPDVEGQEALPAKKTLNNAGFYNISNTVKDYDSDESKEGTVLKVTLVDGTEDVIGQKIDTSSALVIHVATSEDPNAVEVPNAVGLLNYTKDKEEVESYFASCDLKLGKVTTEDSDKTAGLIIEQSIEAGTMVSKGTKIDIVISSGKAASGTVNITISTPSSGSGTLEVYVDNDRVDSKTINYNGSYTYKLTASGEETSIVIKLDGTQVYSATGDFTDDPVKLTNVKTSSVSDTVPNVVGMTVANAKSTLTSAGYTPIAAVTLKSSDTVTEQSPSAGSTSSSKYVYIY